MATPVRKPTTRIARIVPLFCDLKPTAQLTWEDDPNLKLLFPLLRDEAEWMIGGAGFDEALKFANKFGAIPLAQAPTMRIAPSIVTRSEGLLFNLDLPRFAVRMYLDSNHTSFLNLRRMNELYTRFRSIEWTNVDYGAIPTNDPKRQYKIVSGAPTLNELLESQLWNSLADCVLTPAADLRARFHICTADLGWAYGEGRSLRAVPYVRPLRGFSGAACAQACAFMCAALLHDHPVRDPCSVAGVHGLPEISGITTPEAEAYLKLRGMSFHKLVEYFCATGRTVFFHQASGTVNVPASRWLGDRVGTYLRSGFSCILPVCGTSQETDEGESVNHAVLIVGVAKQENASVYLVQDPAVQPFLRRDLEQITTWSQRANDANVKPQLLCVVPREILVPYATATVFELGSNRVAGITEIAEAVQSAPAEISDSILNPYLIKGPNYDPGLFQLASLRLEPHQVGMRLAMTDRSHLLPTEIAFRNVWESLHKYAGRWCWIQRPRPRMNQDDVDSVWIWDAELPAPNHYDLRSCNPQQRHDLCRKWLLGVIFRSSTGTWTHRTFVERPHASDMAIERRVADPRAVQYASREKVADRLTRVMHDLRSSLAGRLMQKQRLLAPCLISSFAPESFATAVKTWPDGMSNCELYAFMHRDEDILSGIVQSDRTEDIIRPSVATLLAAIWRSSTRAKTIKELAVRIARYAKEGSLAVRALATFIPLLMAKQDERHREALDALKTLISLARELRRRGSDVCNLEMVGGSRILGLIPTVEVDALGNAQSELTWFAEREPKSHSLEKLGSLLIGLAEELQLDVRKQEDFFSISIELEPGPLFVVNDLDALRDLIERVKQTRLDPFFGLNVDIAHFALAGIDPASIFADRSLRDRIAHFHISDHGLGHFGDAAIGHCGLRSIQGNTLECFRAWIRKASELAREASIHNRRPRFSGLISIELEAVKSADMVQSTVNTLLALLAEVQSTK